MSELVRGAMVALADSMDVVTVLLTVRDAAASQLNYSSIPRVCCAAKSDAIARVAPQASY